MKSASAAILVLAACARGGRLHVLRASEHSLAHRSVERLANATAAALSSAGNEAKYGSSKCPCVGIDNLEGTTIMGDKSEKFTYPADVGGRCSAWEDGVHPDCIADKSHHDWCHQHWCFVDPCNCELDTPPKPSAYMASGKIQGRTVHYSYATCGGTDTWSTDETKKKALEADHEALCAEKVDEKHWGKSECRCVGIDGQEGVTKVGLEGGKNIDYPADAGARCNAWELERHPDCKGDHAPSWCKQAWCYVDPCSCNLDVPSKPSEFLPDAKYQGRPIHYSYATCGANDTWTSEEKKAQAAEKKDICDDHAQHAEHEHGDHEHGAPHSAAQASGAASLAFLGAAASQLF